MNKYTLATWESYMLLLRRGCDEQYVPMEPVVAQELYELGKTILSNLQLDPEEYVEKINQLTEHLGL